MRTRTSTLLLTALVPAVLLGVSDAAADPVGLTPDAQAHFDAGVRYGTAQDYDRAIDEFKAGYLADPDPEFLFALGQAERQGGLCRSAIVAYNQYLASIQSPSSQPANPEHVDLAQENRDQCEKELARPAPPPPASAPVERVIEVPTPIPLPPVPWYGDALGDTLGGAGLAGVLAGAALLVAGEADARTAASAPTYDTYVSAAQSASSLRSAGELATVAGVAVLGAAALRYWLRPRPDEQPAVGVAPTRGGATLGVVECF